MMLRIDQISTLSVECTGCMACLDACPVGCISIDFKNGGFQYTKIDNDKCIGCGKCYSVCPIVNVNKINNEQHLYAAYSKVLSGPNGGSSGGVFELLATYLLKNGYYVCGAAFEGTRLTHRIINNVNDLNPLLKSKYLQSDTVGIYKQIRDLLLNNNKVFFCGTPCQVSALKNYVPENYSSNLLSADFICHGVPSQKIFDMYIEDLERKHKGKVVEFRFRVKDNRYYNANGYSYTISKNGKKIKYNGVFTQSSFYYAFKRYLFLRESCYCCKYATVNRVADITLADFWGIDKYDFDGDINKGVSMVIINTPRGSGLFESVASSMVYKEFPIKYGIESNYSFTQLTEKPAMRDTIIKCLCDNGYKYTARKYFRSGAKYKIWWLLPSNLREIMKKLIK